MDDALEDRFAVVVRRAMFRQRRDGVSIFAALLDALAIQSEMIPTVISLASELERNKESDNATKRDQEVISAIMANARDRAGRAGRDPDEGDILAMILSLAEAAGQGIKGLPSPKFLEEAARQVRATKDP